MDLSVVVLSWNTAPQTVRALRSAAAGAGGLSVELVLVDNASADDSVARVRREVPEARVIHNDRNLGFAAGNNRALPHLRGRVTCFLNSDAEAGEGALAHVVRWLDRHPAAGIAAPRLVGRDGRPQKAARPEPSRLGLLHRYTALRFTPLGRRAARAWRAVPDAQAPVAVDSVMGSCLLIRTDLLRRLGGFDEGYFFYWEDVDLCRRARDLGAEVWWVPDGPAVLHEGGAATAAAGGPPRLSFVQGLLRYQDKRLATRRARAWRGLFVLLFVLRALVEPAALGARSLRRAARGDAERAARSRRSAGSWIRLLERDAQGLLGCLRARR